MRRDREFAEAHRGGDSAGIAWAADSIWRSRAMRGSRRATRCSLIPAEVSASSPAGAERSDCRDLIGRGRALEMLVTGRRLDATEALDCGLVQKIADESVVNEAIELARTIARARFTI